MYGIGIAHGKFGELLQGVLPGENTNFLVTLPILRYSVVKFNCSSDDVISVFHPPHKTKSASLVNKILDYFELPYSWTLTIESDLEEGKGLGSSTADMVACARAVTQAIEKDLPTDVLLKILKEIEPTDGVMFGGVVCFYHRNVALHSQLGYLSELMIVGADEGGVIDTVKFNQDLRSSTSEEKAEYANLLNDMVRAAKVNDLNKIGAIATRSAVIHQAINPKKHLDFFIALCNESEALGVIVAHSGTYIGIILDKNDPSHEMKLSFIENKIKKHSLKPEKFNTFSKKNDYLTKNGDILREESVY